MKGVSAVLKSVQDNSESRQIFYFLCVNFVLMNVEFLTGVWSNSMVLISDAFHMLFDCAALVVGLYASITVRTKPPKNFPYGYGRFEVLSGFTNSILLITVVRELRHWVWPDFACYSVLHCLALVFSSFKNILSHADFVRACISNVVTDFGSSGRLDLHRGGRPAVIAAAGAVRQAGAHIVHRAGGQPHRAVWVQPHHLGPALLAARLGLQAGLDGAVCDEGALDCSLILTICPGFSSSVPCDIPALRVPHSSCLYLYGPIGACNLTSCPIQMMKRPFATPGGVGYVPFWLVSHHSGCSELPVRAPCTHGARGFLLNALSALRLANSC